MKYLLSFLILMFFLLGCDKNEPSTNGVVFTASNFYIEQGKLKSFDINEWEHFHCPYTVNVTLTNDVNPDGIVVSAENSNAFFEDGTEAWYLPYGVYTAKVEGGGYPDNAESYSSPYYFWTIKDTVIEITAESNVIRFNLDKTPSLFVVDHLTDHHLKLEVLRWINDSLQFNGRGEYDYAYLTPWEYRVTLIDPNEEKTSAWVDAKEGEYTYFIVNESVETSVVVTIPEFVGDSIILR